MVVLTKKITTEVLWRTTSSYGYVDCYWRIPNFGGQYLDTAPIFADIGTFAVPLPPEVPLNGYHTPSQTETLCVSHVILKILSFNIYWYLKMHHNRILNKTVSQGVYMQ